MGNEQSNPVEARVREVVDGVPREFLGEEVLGSSEASCDVRMKERERDECQ